MSSAILSIASLRPSLPSAVGCPAAIPASASATQLERLDELGLRVAELVGRVEILEPVQQRLRRAAVGCDLRLELLLIGVLRRLLSRVKNSIESWLELSDDRLRGRRRSSQSRAACAR